MEQVLLPELHPGQIMVMDNLMAHKTEKVRELVEGAGCEVFYLPPYSPDFNPIEEAFSKIKGILRKIEARSREALVEAMGGCDFVGHRRGCIKLLRTLRLWHASSIVLTIAVGDRLAESKM